MMRASFLRRSPLLLLAAALVALAVFFMPGGQPAQAQQSSVWSATLTVADTGGGGTLLGCENPVAGGSCSSTSVLTDDDFTYGGVDYEIVRIDLIPSSGFLRFELNKAIPADLKAALTLHLGSSQFPIANAALTQSDKRASWGSTGLSWSVGDTVSVSLTELKTVTLSASPNPVDEGSPVTITATLSTAVGDDDPALTIPLIITDDTAEPGDHGTLASIRIATGASMGVGAISTVRDADGDNESFTVSLDTANLPSGVAAGAQSSVTVTIRDDGLGAGEVTSLQVCWDESASGSFADCTLAIRTNYGWRSLVDDAATHVKVTPTLQRAGTSVTVGSLSVVSGSQSGAIALDTGDDEIAEAARLLRERTSGSRRVRTTLTQEERDAIREAARVNTNINLAFSDSAGVPRQYILSVQRVQLAEEPAAAQPGTVWSAVLNVQALVVAGVIDDGFGCSGTGSTACSTPSILTDDTFTVGGVEWTIRQVRDAADRTALDFNIYRPGVVDPPPPSAELKALNFCVGTRAFSLSGLTGGVGSSVSWNLDIGWSAGDVVQLSIASACTARPVVSLAASPTTVDEGGSVALTVSLSEAPASRVTIPLSFTNGTAESSDYSAPRSITINAGETSASATITARQDSDTRDETFTVSLGALPSSVVAGSPSAVEITIVDDDLPLINTGGGESLEELPIDDSVTPVPPSQRTPTGTGASASDGYCYTRVGNSATEYVRYPDGRLVETHGVSEYIRSLYACE